MTQPISGRAAVNARPGTPGRKAGSWRVMRLCGLASGLITVAVALLLAFPPRRDLETSIDIPAPPSRVWAVLTDTGSYPAWNPDMVLKGALIPGQVIEHDEGSGADRMVFHPTIVTAAPPRELAWRGQVVMPRVLDALHYFRLRAVGGHTLFTQGEHLRGVLLYAWDADQLLPHFEAMNARLKARVAQRFPSAAPPPTSPP